MNERIRELAEQAGAETWSRAPMRAITGLAFTDENLEKFAELIVRECADLYTHDDVMAPVGQSAYGEAYQDGWIEGTKSYRETILEYFGVE
jgi:hypothetical protein